MKLLLLSNAQAFFLVADGRAFVAFGRSLLSFERLGEPVQCSGAVLLRHLMRYLCLVHSVEEE